MNSSKWLWLVGATWLALILANFTQATKQSLRKEAIVFNPKTPKVFYCPQNKASHSAKVIVRARPLDRLCQFGGMARPKGEPSDCYKDLDESEFACEEKRRFQVSLMQFQ